MSIDVVDIGGAARGGVPVIPPARDGDGKDDDEGELLTAPIPRQQEVPVAAQKSVVSGATVLYPESHPAVSSDLAQSADGALIVGRGQTAIPKSVVNTDRGLNTSSIRDKNEKQLDALLAGEQAAEKAQAPHTARSAAGQPLIEVIFNTTVGAIVSYFHKVVESGNWLVLVTDNKASAQARFIPKPVEGPDGKYMLFELVITGADKKMQKRTAKPLGMQFSVDDYDFVVMMLMEPEESQ